MNLPLEKRNAAIAFIHEKGRPLERSLAAYCFREGSPKDVWGELAKFQNPDGGFGRALEPDFRLPASSALATSIALQILRDTGAEADHPLVRNAVEFLLKTYDGEHGFWPIIPAHDNTAPHAPWWRYDPEKMSRWDEQRANPGAQLVAHLRQYRSLVPPGFLEESTGTLVSHLDTLPDSMEMHDIGCYLFLAEDKSLPVETRERIVEKLCRATECVLAREPSQWGSYGLKPLDVAPAPDSPLASMISTEVQRNLDYEIERQDADGSWAPNWSWGGAFSEEWPTAEREWRGVLTLKTLKTLRNHRRLV